MAPLVERGKLPVNGRSDGARRVWISRTLQPTYSPVIWTSVATGKVAGRARDPTLRLRRSGGGKDKSYYSSGHRKTKAFWNILSDYDLTVHCIGCGSLIPQNDQRCHGDQTNSTKILKNPELAMWKGTLIKGLPDQVFPRAARTA